MTRGARDYIRLLVDEGSYVSWGLPAEHDLWDVGYRATLARAEIRAGTDESVLTGEGRILGHRLVLVVSEFAFLGGSIGRDAAGRIVAAIHRATAEGLPVLALPASGGTRMQEGTPAFVMMAEIARAIAEHRAAGHAYLTYLRHPTTGGVFGSWGTLGQVVWGEPGALTGFLGPKVYEHLYGKPFPKGVQTSTHLAKIGVIDEVVAPEDLRDRLTPLLSLLVDPARWGLAELGPNFATPAAEISGSAAIASTLRPERPALADLLASPFIAEQVEVFGTQAGERDSAVRIIAARLHGKSCVIIGQDRANQIDNPVSPAALRTAQRGIELARQWRLPLVSVVDTPGALLSRGAEDKALAGEIARTMAALATLAVPNVSVLLGQGCGGAALAMLPARAVVAVDDAWLTALPAAGASAIVFNDVDHADEMADRQNITAHALQRVGFVQQIVTMDDVHLAIADHLWRQRA